MVAGPSRQSVAGQWELGAASRSAIGCSMMCKKPFRKGNLSHGCGQCTHCRINKVRLWVGRMQLEAQEHPVSSFLTLTYDQDNLPQNGSVDKREIQLFMKKLRGYSGEKFRYFAVGEYGDRTQRPHYHAIIFGLCPTRNDLVEKCWKKGHVYYGVGEPDSMSYCASYVVKKMTKPGDPRLGGRTPEFALMSRNPAIGSGVVPRLIKAYNTEKGVQAFAKSGWVSNEVRISQKRYSIGAVLTAKLHKGLGLEKEDKRIHTAERSRQVWELQREKTATQIDAEFKAKLSQQNSKIRMKRKLL